MSFLKKTKQIKTNVKTYADKFGPDNFVCNVSHEFKVSPIFRMSIRMVQQIFTIEGKGTKIDKNLTEKY